MPTLSDTALTLVAFAMMAAALYLALRLRRKPPAPPKESQAWDHAAVQRFFSEIEADEKLFGVAQKKDSAEDRSRKAAQLREIEALLNSSDYLSLSEEQQEMRIKLLADESVVRLVDEAKHRSRENEELILDLRAKREQEAAEFIEMQKQRDADIARLGEMERRAAAGGDRDQTLRAEIDALKRRMAMAKYVGARPPDS